MQFLLREVNVNLLMSCITCFYRMAYFERVSVFLTQENLIAQIRRHYTMQVGFSYRIALFTTNFYSTLHVVFALAYIAIVQTNIQNQDIDKDINFPKEKKKR